MYSLIPFARNDLFRVFDNFEKNWTAAPLSKASFRCDIKDQGDHFQLEAELPGFSKQDIKLEVVDERLIVSATREETNEKTDKKDGYIRRERFSGSFSRSFNVSNIDTQAIAASYENGVLQLTLPKKKELQPETRQIEIA